MGSGALPPLPAPSPPTVADPTYPPHLMERDRCFHVFDECMRDYGERVPWGRSANSFDGLQARAALSNVDLSHCFEMGAHASAWAQVVFLPSGGVLRVHLYAPHHGIETRDCITEHIDLVRVRPFGGGPRSIEIKVH